MENYNRYVYGSVAPKLPQEPQKRDAQEQVPGKAMPRLSQSSLPKLQMIFCVIFMVAVSFIILYRYSAISELGNRMGKLTAEYNSLRDENRMLKVEIEKSINLDNVKQIAETKLRMHKPYSYQLVLVDVPKSDYNVVVNQSYIDEATRSVSILGKIVDTVKAILP